MQINDDVVLHRQWLVTRLIDQLIKLVLEDHLSILIHLTTKAILVNQPVLETDIRNAQSKSMLRIDILTICQFISSWVSVLQGSDVLTLLAEIFVAFAGFTGIVAALGHRSIGKWRPVDVIRFQALLVTSLAGLVFSVAPFGFHYFGVAEAITWGFGSALLAVCIVYFIVTTTQKHNKLQANADPDFVPGVRLALLTLGVPVIASQLLNAIGVGLPHSFSGFLVGLLYLLILCCAMFVLLLRFVRTDAA